MDCRSIIVHRAVLGSDCSLKMHSVLTSILIEIFLARHSPPGVTRSTPVLVQAIALRQRQPNSLWIYIISLRTQVHSQIKIHGQIGRCRPQKYP